MLWCAGNECSAFCDSVFDVCVREGGGEKYKNMRSQ